MVTLMKKMVLLLPHPPVLPLVLLQSLVQVPLLICLMPLDVPNQCHGNLIQGKSTRDRRTPDWLANYDAGEEHALNVMMLMTESDPVTFEEANKEHKWKEAVTAYIKAIERNQTWELTRLPTEVNWVFKIKFNELG